MQRSYSSTIIFLFLLSLSANHLAQAQAIFSHDFENGLNPMKVVDVDNRNPHPDKANFDGEWSVKLTSEGAVGVQSSWYSPAGQSDDWLITPAISITDANTQLRWQARAFNANFREDYEVLLSTTDDATSSFIQPLFDMEGERTTW
ncbi:MAG: choice-of-anchor J domain-containing protein, partial [Bacteroidota bacterium]